MYLFCGFFTDELLDIVKEEMMVPLLMEKENIDIKVTQTGTLLQVLQFWSGTESVSMSS